MGKRDPRLNDANNIDVYIQRMYRANGKKDPPPNRVKPVPVQVLRRIFTVAMQHNDPFLSCLVDMIARPGKYTGTKSDTTPFEFKGPPLSRRHAAEPKHCI